MSRRHLLIVGSQCPATGHLTMLKKAAVELQSVLLEPSIGACEPAHHSGKSLLLEARPGYGLSVDEIRTMLKEVHSYASDSQAELVLAFLGHGFGSEKYNDLHFMAYESQADDTESSLNIRDELRRMLESSRLRGLTVLIDTCYAGAAVPDIRPLQAGRQMDFAMLAAANAFQPAEGFNFSFALAKLLRTGIEDAGMHLGVQDIATALQRWLPGQSIVAVGGGQPWLARNRPRAVAGQGTVGPLGRQWLTDTLSGLTPPMTVPRFLDRQMLIELRADVGERDETDPATWKAEWTIDALLLTTETARVVREILVVVGVDTMRLHEALRALDRIKAPPSVINTPPHTLLNEVQNLEYVALCRSGPKHPPARVLAEYVTSLASQVPDGFDNAAFVRWTEFVGPTFVTNAKRRASEVRLEAKLRLVIGLHTSVGGGWPQELVAWLLEEDQLRASEKFDCKAANRIAAEKAVHEALEWAHRKAWTLKCVLKHVDVVLPTDLLMEWRPEECRKEDLDISLGHQYDVAMRWSWRIDPPSGFKTAALDWIRQQLNELVEGEVSLHWIEPDAARDLAKLRSSLAGATYAVGLLEPPDRGDVLDRMLSRLPVVLWPHAPVPSPADLQDAVDKAWHTLPPGLYAAYRAKQRDGRTTTPLSEIRAVWDDPQWLSFCYAHNNGATDGVSKESS